MRIVLLWTISLFISAVSVSAEPIVVRAGEHGNFTRLVMQLPQGAEWRLEEDTGSARVVLTDHSDGFDLTFAFNVIPRIRLRELLAQPSSLEMLLTCECPIEAFMERSNFLVLDIRDGPALSERDDTRLRQSVVPETNFSYGQLLWRQVNPDAFRDEELNAFENPSSPISGSEEAPSNETAGLLLKTQERLLEAFSQAASTGILEIQREHETTARLPETREQVGEIYDSSALTSDLPAATEGQIRVTDSRDVPDDARPEKANPIPVFCENADLVDLASWGSDTSFATQIGRSNERLFDEFGRLRPEEVIVRAKLYLFFGFGAEARQTFSALPTTANVHPEWMDIANILEYGHAKNPRSVHRFAACDSDLALWGILAAKDLPKETDINALAALRGLKRLPSHLQLFLAQELGKRFLQRDDIANAGIAMRLYENLAQNAQGKAKILNARRSSLQGDRNEATRILAQIVTQNTPEAHEAISDMVDTLLLSGEPIPADLVLLAETYAFEHRNSDAGHDLQRTLILATAASGQFKKAFTRLRSFKAQDSSASSTELVSFVFAELSKHADDAEFLTEYFSHYSAFSGLIDWETSAEVASRLFRLGFHEQAKGISEQITSPAAPKKLRVLRSQILLHEGNFHDSIREVQGLDGDEVSRIRGEAFSKLGDATAAAQSFEEAGLPDRAVEALWLGGDWSRSFPASIPVFGELFELANEEIGTLVVDDEMIANSQAAIKSSAEARQALQNALSALTIQ